MDNTDYSRARPEPRRVRASAAYREALARAGKVLRKPEKLGAAINQAAEKAARLPAAHTGEFRRNLASLFRMLRAYLEGSYRDISWANLVLIVAAIIYFITPVDLIPDFLTVLGYVDDAAIIAWTLKTVADEIEPFLAWEARQTYAPRQPVDLAED